MGSEPGSLLPCCRARGESEHQRAGEHLVRIDDFMDRRPMGGEEARLFKADETEREAEGECYHGTHRLEFLYWKLAHLILVAEDVEFLHLPSAPCHLKEVTNLDTARLHGGEGAP